MVAVEPGQSHLKEGDYFVIPDDRLEQQTIYDDMPLLRCVHEISIEDAVPLQTVRCFHGGASPVEYHRGSRLRVRIYRVISDFVPR